MYKDYKLLGIDLATGGDYTSFGDTIVQNKPKCLNCGRKLNNEPPEFNNCCCYACWKKWKNK